MRCAARLLIVLLVGAVGAGCQRMCRTVVPDVVEVGVPEYVPVPHELTEPVPLAKPATYTCGEAVRVARERRASVEQCNRQLEAIRDLGDE